MSESERDTDATETHGTFFRSRSRSVHRRTNASREQTHLPDTISRPLLVRRFQFANSFFSGLIEGGVIESTHRFLSLCLDNTDRDASREFPHRPLARFSFAPTSGALVRFFPALQTVRARDRRCA